MTAPSAMVLGMGLATPAHAALQVQTAALGASVTLDDPSQAALVAGLYARAGVARRASVVLRAEAPADRDLDQTFFPASRDAHWPTTAERMREFDASAGALAIAASRRAMVDAGILPAQITDLITVSCTGLSSPGVDVSLMAGLPLPPGVRRVNIGFMGCHGAIVALRTAADLVRAGQTPGARPRRALVVCIELCSLHLQRTARMDQHVSNALFADGCAAMVVGAEPAAHPGDQPASPANAVTTPLSIVDSSSMLFPMSETAMAWHIGDHGFEMTLDRAVPSLLERHLAPWLWPWLRTHMGRHADADDVRWAIHPGGPRVLDAVARALGLSDEHTRESRAVLREHGNMSSPTVLFVVDRLRARRDDLRPIVLLAFGPGLTGEASLIRPTPDRPQGWPA